MDALNSEVARVLYEYPFRVAAPNCSTHCNRETHTLRQVGHRDAERSISLKHVQPEKVVGVSAAHPVLDNLKIPKASSSIRYQSLAESKNYLLEKFPEGFYGQRFSSEERDYKVQAHEMAVELLNSKGLQSLLAASEYSEICARALKLVNATNLIFPNEKMALKDGLAEPKAKAMFAKVLDEMLHGQGAINDRFSSFTNVLAEIGADKWTTASYFLFFFKPCL